MVAAMVLGSSGANVCEVLAALVSVPSFSILGRVYCEKYGKTGRAEPDGNGACLIVFSLCATFSGKHVHRFWEVCSPLPGNMCLPFQKR